MCGISGILNLGKTNVDLAGKSRLMISTLSHRGPDSSNTFLNGNIALGHCRLSIIDLSNAANQPFVDTSGRYHIVFNGEIYNYGTLKEKLDYSFTTSSDTEVLLAAFIKWGPACLDLLNGMFAFAIWDSELKSLFVARDRLGVKPLYYFKNENYFIFSSEIRSILSTGLVSKNINYVGLRSFFAYQSVNTPYSLLEGISQLEAGCYIVLDQHSYNTSRYWSIESRKFLDFDFTDKLVLHDTLQGLLRNAVSRRLVSDVPVGAFLSGGIDSSAIVALMSQITNEPINTFTIGFQEAEYDESEYAEMVSKKFATNHNKIILSPQSFIDELPNALNAMDTPTGDGINTYVVAKAIKKVGITVALSGIGGDELFAGYPFFKHFLNFKKYERLWGLGKFLHESVSLLRVGSAYNYRIQEMLMAPNPSIEYIYSSFRKIVSDSDLKKLTKLDTCSDILVGKLSSINERLKEFPLLSQVSIAEYLGYTQNTLLKDTDQMSMAVSLEVREPFFDFELIEFVLGVPDNYKIAGYPKKLLVDTLNGLIPDEIIHRKKQGFVLPWNIWMRNELRSFCETYLRRIAERDFINGENLMCYWSRFLKDDKSIRWMEIWLFVVLEYWMEKNGIE